MVTYQLEDEFAGTVYVKHLGESGSDRLAPIFESSTGLDVMILLKWFLLPAMHSVRLHQAFGRWKDTLTQTELSIIMKSSQLTKWKPLLIEGEVLPDPTPYEKPDPDVHY
jgi:hypothetical protein